MPIAAKGSLDTGDLLQVRHLASLVWGLEFLL